MISEEHNSLTNTVQTVMLSNKYENGLALIHELYHRNSASDLVVRNRAYESYIADIFQLIKKLPSLATITLEET